MGRSIGEELWLELCARGFSPDGESPHGSMGLAGVQAVYSTSAALAELLELMVARREKISRSFAVVGREAATKSYDDAAVVIGRLSLG